MTKTKAYRLILWVLTLAWGCAVLCFSLQSGEQSSALSSGFTVRLLGLFRAYRELSAEQQVTVLGMAHGIVRELAHVAEYTLLGLLSALLVHSYRVRRFFVLPFAPLAVFAILDECLQEFATVARAFQLIDLLKDWLGCLLGIACVWLVCFVKKRKQ